MKAIQNGYLKRYLEDTLRLYRTMVIKYSDAAELMNQGIIAQYGSDAVDVDRPTTWKYYMNLAGKYHPTDTVMQVISIDTHETIDFTRENFKIHTATEIAYRYGTRNYFDLVRRYPTQEGLINTILLPCDIDFAIEAEDGTVLCYDRPLVESNEASLILNLEEYLKSTFFRWYNRAYIMSNRYYPMAFYTSMTANIAPKLLLLRQQACKSPEAHSFHVQMYLASHGQLDRYLPYLTLNQSLWLYRNIRYLQRRAGFSENFDLIVDRLLTKRGIPLNEYSIRQKDEFDDRYLPAVQARGKPIGSVTNDSSVEYHGVPLLYKREEELTVDNYEHIGATLERDLEVFQTNNSGVLQTKVLHSSMVDYSNSVPDPISEIALREWYSMSRHGFYNVLVTFQNPKDSISYTLVAQDAFIYAQYISLMADGIVIDHVPQYLNVRQRRHPRPSVDDLMSIAGDDYSHLRYIAEAIVNGQPLMSSKYSVSAFYEHVSILAEQAYWHWFQISSMHEMYERGIVENMTHRLYEDVLGTYDTAPVSMGEWLKSRNLPEYDLNYEQSQTLVQNLFEASTGIRTDSTKVLKNIQKALIALVTELSSYHVQITRSINEDPIVSINWPAIRLGGLRSEASHKANPDVSVLVTDSSGSSSSAEHIETKSDEISSASDEVVQVRHIDISSSTAGSIESSCLLTDIAGNITADVSYTGQDEALEERIGLPGYTTYFVLSESQKRTLKSIYRSET